VTRRPSWPLAGLTVLALAAAVLPYTGTGRLITARVPGNAIGWLLAQIGLLLAGVMLTEQYALYGLVTTVRLRTKVTKGHGSKAAALTMAFRLIESAQRRWRVVNAPDLVALVRAGAHFERGVLVERPEAAAA
jgi:hypothetical protein